MWIVIECHGGPQYATICVDADGNNMIFSTEEEAQKYADEECQEGLTLGIY